MQTDSLAHWRTMAAGTLVETLGIELLEIDADRVVATMPVERRVHQPFGLLHGGASVALAETVASVGASMNLDPALEFAVGLEINANHVRGVDKGLVTATAVPVHRGRTTQVWEIRIVDGEGRLACISRCTLGVRAIPS